jgi:hypothetical protein
MTPRRERVEGGTVLPVPRVHVGFVEDRVALGLFFHPFFYSDLSFDPTSILRHSFITDSVNLAVERMTSNMLWKKGCSFLPLQMLR